MQTPPRSESGASSPVQDGSLPVVHIDRELRLAFCLYDECRVAIVRKEAESHYRGKKNDKHWRLSKRQKDEAIECIVQSEHVVDERTDIVLPIHGPPPDYCRHVDVLDGLKCDLCDAVYLAVDTARHHTCEGNSRPRQRGRPPLGVRPVARMHPVSCQRFWKHGAQSKLFEVVPQPQRQPRSIQLAASSSSQPSHADGLAEIFRQGELAREVHRELLQGEPATTTNSFLTRSKADDYLVRNGWSFEDAQARIAPPSHNETVLREIWNGANDLFARAHHDLLEKGGVSMMARFLVVRSDPQRVSYVPLMPYQHPSKLSQYARPWKQVLAFICRPLLAHFASDPEPGQPVPGQGYDLSVEQKAAWLLMYQSASARADVLAELASRTDGDTSDLSLEDCGPPAPVQYRAKEGPQRETRLPRAPSPSEDEPEKSALEQWADTPPQMNDLNATEDSSTALTKLQLHILAFCITLLAQDIQRQEFESPLVCAMSLIYTNKTGWDRLDACTSAISAIVKGSRLFVLQHALELQRAGAPQPMLKQLDCFVQAHMIRGGVSAMAWFLDLRTYGRRISSNTTAEGQVSWSGDTLSYGGNITISVSRFKRVLRDFVSETRAIIAKALLKDKSLPSVDFRKLMDHNGNEESGYSWRRGSKEMLEAHTSIAWYDARLREGGCELGPMIASILDWVRTRGQRAAGDRPGPCNPRCVDDQALKQFFELVRCIRERLLILAHLLGGQPSRGPELLSVLRQNSPGTIRGTYIMDDMYALVPRYHKGYSQSQQVKIIYHFYPSDVGECFVWFEQIILPLADELAFGQGLIPDPEAIKLFGLYELWPSYVFPRDQAYDSVRFSKLLMNFFKDRLDCHEQLVGLAKWRHIAIAIGRQMLKEPSFGEETEDAELDDEGDEEENITQGYKHLKSLQEALDLQAGHGSFIATMRYAREAAELTGGTCTRRAMMRQLSKRWHALLLDCDTQGKLLGPDNRVTGPQLMELRLQQIRRKTADELLLAYTRRTNKLFQWKPGQDIVIEKLLSGATPVVAILPTGGGKSLTFLLLAAASAGLTIVVVPLVAIIASHESQCQALQIKSQRWQKGCQLSEGVQVVFATPEVATSTEFCDAAAKWVEYGRVDRVVIDETHYQIDEDKVAYRGSFRKLDRLQGLRVQQLHLSATIPPARQHELAGVLNTTVENIEWVRRPTGRVNVAERIDVDLPGTKYKYNALALKAFVENVYRTDERLRDQEHRKAVIFVTKTDIADRFAKELGEGWFAYHGKMEASAGEEALRRFKESPSAYLLTTSAFSAGADVSGINLIMHQDIPVNIEQLAQELGRGGRGGNFCLHIMCITPKQMDQAREHGKLVAFGEPVDDALHDFIATTGCRRQVLDAVLDGNTERTKCGGGEAACDNCARMVERTMVMNAAQARLRAEYVEKLLLDEHNRDVRVSASTNQRPVHEQAAAIDERRLEVKRDAQETLLLLDKSVAFWQKTCARCFFACESVAGLQHSMESSECPSMAALTPTARKAWSQWDGDLYGALVDAYDARSQKNSGLRDCRSCFHHLSRCDTYRYDPEQKSVIPNDKGPICQSDAINSVIRLAIWLHLDNGMSARARSSSWIKYITRLPLEGLSTQRRVGRKALKPLATTLARRPSREKANQEVSYLAHTLLSITVQARTTILESTGARKRK